jgi:hypothetical protein
VLEQAREAGPKQDVVVCQNYACCRHSSDYGVSDNAWGRRSWDSDKGRGGWPVRPIARRPEPKTEAGGDDARRRGPDAD